MACQMHMQKLFFSQHGSCKSKVDSYANLDQLNRHEAFINVPVRIQCKGKCYTAHMKYMFSFFSVFLCTSENVGTFRTLHT